MWKLLGAFLIAIILLSCVGYFYRRSRISHYPQTAASVDIKKYMGVWYEIALIPNRYEMGCRCTTDHYKLVGNKISLSSSCIRLENNQKRVATAKLWPTDETNSKFKIQFAWPFLQNYWIFYIAPDYKYAIVGTPSRLRLWILGREKTISQSKYIELVGIAKQKGLFYDRLIRADQSCENDD